MPNPTTSAAPAGLRCEYRLNPLGIDVPQPRLSWLLRDTRRGARQTAYHVAVASSAAQLDKGSPDVWDTGKVPGDQSIHIPYAGPKLASAQRCHWRVRTWDADGQPSDWSQPAWWEMGLLDRREWTGQWIGASLVGGLQTGVPCPYLRKSFTLDRPVARARLYVTALGLYEFYLNGQRVGDDVFTPGWTDYNKRVQYQVYDVSRLLNDGENVAGAILGDGWYCGHLATRGRQNYGDRPKLLAQVAVELDDGSGRVIVTDASWTTATGPLLESDLLMGESVDARLEMPGWNAPGFDDAEWQPARLFDDPGIPIVASASPPVRAVETLNPAAEPVEQGRHRAPPRWIFDLGQNMVGRVRLKVRGEAGETLTLRHAEMLNPDGSLYTDNLRTAQATDRYTLRGDGDEIFEPRFTFHGFRYVELTGFKEPPPADMLTGVVLHTDLDPAGTFDCSDPLINQLQHNILWGQKGNFLEVPTDCPQRDERLGWTGDAQIFVRTATFNMNVAPFFTKWQRDLVDAQSERGAIPSTVPHVNVIPGSTAEGDGGPAWADAFIICPWTIYLCYGDRRILENHYPALVRFIDYLESTSHDFIRVDSRFEKRGGYGDWLAIDATRPGRAPTPKDLIGTACFAHVTRLMARVARALDKPDDARRFDELLDNILAAFNREFVTPAGRVLGQTQTGYLLALGFDLLPEPKRPAALAHLVREIELRDWHLSTGFVGTPLLAPVLSRFGRDDAAYRLLFQETYPSWLYTVLQGATTMWERWNSWTREDGFGDASMNSFNHYAYGAIGQWLYATVAGIDADAESPGYRHILIRPRPHPRLEHAGASLDSMYGRIESRWRVDGETFYLDVTIPPNTTATVSIPTSDPASVTEGGRPLDAAEHVRVLSADDHAATCKVPAGRYEFKAALVVSR